MDPAQCIMEPRQHISNLRCLGECAAVHLLVLGIFFAAGLLLTLFF